MNPLCETWCLCGVNFFTTKTHEILRKFFLPRNHTNEHEKNFLPRNHTNDHEKFFAMKAHE